jgi:hypothetical protein
LRHLDLLLHETMISIKAMTFQISLSLSIDRRMQEQARKDLAAHEQF